MSSATPPGSKHLARTLVTILILGFTLLAPIQTHAKKVKIQPNIYQKVLKNRTKDPTVNKIVQAALQGKIGYVGKIENVKEISKKVNKAMGMHFVTWKAVERRQPDNYYTPMYNAPIKTVTNDEISYKNRQAYWIYYIYGDSQVVQSCKNRKRYWALAQQSVRKAGVRNGMSDDEAVKRISKWICKRTRYVAGGIDNCKNGTLFTKGRGVCRDYADAM